MQVSFFTWGFEEIQGTFYWFLEKCGKNYFKVGLVEVFEFLLKFRIRIG
jgi:hypothetical protein